MKNVTIKFIVIFVLIFICCSCHFKSKEQIEDEKKEEEWKKYAEQTVNHWIGRKMILPELPIVFPDSTSLNYKGTYRAPIKIVTFIDGSCDVCVSSLLHWRKFINEVNRQKMQCDFMFYIYADNKNDFQSDIYSTLKLSVPWIFDEKTKFISANNLLDLRFQTALLNEKDQVIMIGNIMLRPQLEALYKDIIERKNKKGFK